MVFSDEGSSPSHNSPTKGEVSPLGRPSQVNDASTNLGRHAVQAEEFRKAGWAPAWRTKRAPPNRLRGAVVTR